MVSDFQFRRKRDTPTSRHRTNAKVDDCRPSQEPISKYGAVKIVADWRGKESNLILNNLGPKGQPPLANRVFGQPLVRHGRPRP